MTETLKPSTISIGTNFRFVPEKASGEINLTELKINGESWFVGIELAKGLCYYNTTNMTKKLDKRGWTKIKPSILEGLGYKIHSKNDIVILNESGLWNAILDSTKPEAKEFKYWVTSVLLPTLRKQGYIDLRKEYEHQIDDLKHELDAETKFAGEMLRDRDWWKSQALIINSTAIKYVPVSTEENAKGKTPVRGALRKTPEPRLDKSYAKALRKTLKTHTIDDWLWDKLKACYEANRLKGEGARLTQTELSVIELADHGCLVIQTTFFH